jgi:hypothetical protein
MQVLQTKLTSFQVLQWQKFQKQIPHLPSNDGGCKYNWT